MLAKGLKKMKADDYIEAYLLRRAGLKPREKFKVSSPYREAIKVILKINSKSVNIVQCLETVYLVTAFADIPRREQLIIARLVKRKKRLINNGNFNN
jgi:hypothetical protein